MKIHRMVWGTFLSISFWGATIQAQKIEFTEYDMPNGLHVILHEDHNAPVVAVSVMYHVGSKNESPGRTGFAHFFEHLLFEGTENIKRGEFFKIVSAGGGQNNANTTQDRTFYYEEFPSNQLKLGLWLESERMLHPVINPIGVKTQNEVVKEEKRQSFENRPYGKVIDAIASGLFKVHPYKNGVIGSMRDLDSAKLDEFKSFFHHFYAPNNAVLAISGDFDSKTLKGLIDIYFGPVPRGEEVVYKKLEEPVRTSVQVDTTYDANIQIPAILAAYQVPGKDSRDSKIMEMISAELSGGASSKMYKKMVDVKKNALQVFAFNYALEDYGIYIIGALPNNGAPLSGLLSDMDEEIVKLQKDLISEEEYRKLQNKFEDAFVSANTKMLGIDENLAGGYLFYHKNTNHINEELKEIRSISREDIREAARKYLGSNQRLVLYYLPGKAKIAQ